MSGSLLFLSALVSAVSDGAYALVAGLLLASIWLAQQEGDRLHDGVQWTLRRLLMVSIGAVAVCDLLRPFVLAASMSGSLELGDLLPTIPQVLLQTHQGTIWFISTGAVVLLFASSSILGQRRRGLRNICVASCLVVLAFCKAASGHAADNGDFTLGEILQMLHVLATAVWAGGVAVSAFVVIPRIVKSEATEVNVRYATRLSNAATVAVIVLAISGVYTAAREANDSISALWTSAWGQVLGVKIAFVTAALAMGAFNRFVCLRAPVAPVKLATMARVLISEATALTIAVLLSGLLGSLSPPEST